jgi:hypothetical protein
MQPLRKEQLMRCRIFLVQLGLLCVVSCDYADRRVTVEVDGGPVVSCGKPGVPCGGPAVLDQGFIQPDSELIESTSCNPSDPMSCTEDEISKYPFGTCQADGSCTCDQGFSLDPKTIKCRSEETIVTGYICDSLGQAYPGLPELGEGYFLDFIITKEPPQAATNRCNEPPITSRSLIWKIKCGHSSPCGLFLDLAEPYKFVGKYIKTKVCEHLTKEAYPPKCEPKTIFLPRDFSIL